MPTPERCVAVIPCLNEAATIAALVRETLTFIPRVIVVDDGSSDATASIAENAGALVVRCGNPGGKGRALAQGFSKARELGYLWALALDGDGQHSPGEIPSFLSAARGGARMVVGNRMGSAAQMPPVRRWVNRWMSRTLSAYAGADWPDTQCGFRLVNLASWAQSACRAAHFEIESELLVRFAAAGHTIEFVPIATRYGGERSKIRPLLDTWRWLCWWHGIRRELEAAAQDDLNFPDTLPQTNGARG